MQQLKIDELKAKALYPTASKEFKAMLEDSFGKDFFSQKITDRVKSFEDACLLTGRVADDADFHTGTPDEIAYKKLKVIALALNEGVTLSFANSNQKKWRPWFEYSGSGFRFYDTYCGFTFTTATGGSRLCFHSEELARYAGTQFIDLYNQLLN